ncbi:hypothetical protein CONCODRAFT_14464 [Conidiobolus coronatus NRRL 28638]|uniref:Large ribosomal subunit protein uL30m n=1 Tax=Conidiobolus coronatus (strain ATCC 28846 / CBS 209.66 / NRRL 28638) TaxID=796925 RepID=A0A137PIQ2_CONC2|nr:hypothetical protein CONCODRAFT_14464 [Conidiobolus coronatus NRRL 28638]|eukprot:KXN74884.1 hypothetical protein CONCODRAFT_14464 [Conidiobolus coronatus NRRL 28638]
MDEAVQTPLKKYFKVTLKRSTIGLHPRTRDAAKFMGLKKVGRTVFLETSEKNVGHIFRVKELVKVELTDNTTLEDRSPPKGYEILSSRN